MSIKVKLNDESFRYDIYQIIALYYPFNEVSFVQEDYDLGIFIKDDILNIEYRDIIEEYTLGTDVRKKEAVKKGIFLFLQNLSNISYPWGTMVGIRPSKIAMDLIHKGLSEEEIIKYYYQHYLVQESKARLCLEVAGFEKKVINKDKEKVSIYVGMPFCPTRCSYCSFASNPIERCRNIVEPYLHKLAYEIESTKHYIKANNLKIETIYFGGGTPTSVDNSEFEYIMGEINKFRLPDNDLIEFTVECGRPDSITEEKLETMKKYGVHRISINPQTMNNLTLRRIGRNHSSKDVIDRFNLARSLGFDNINMDLIVGLPGEGIEEMEETCRQIARLNPESITVHGMSIKRASRLHEDILENRNSETVRQEELHIMYNKTRDLATGLGMHPYYMYRQKNMAGNMENVGYSKPGREGIYNVQMIEERQTIIALGADAVSKVVFHDENRIERFANVKDVREYINRCEEMVEKKYALLDSLYKK